MKTNYGKTHIAPTLEREMVETPQNPNPPNADDIACASAACDMVAGCNGQVTGSHLARVAQLFADHRVKVEDAIAADFRKALESANAGDEKAKS